VVEKSEGQRQRRSEEEGKREKENDRDIKARGRDCVKEKELADKGRGNG
jgi:hypothetical protein